jgi:glycosyltransferase involved in cell wall biosynthesis
VKKVLIFYQYFLPAYKAGGPIQSIANMCRQMSDEYRFYIVCGSVDYGETEDLPTIRVNEWNDFENGIAAVYYLSSQAQTAGNIKKLIREISADHLFIIGIYAPVFSLTPLLFSSSRKTLSVRGMLHPGALSQKSLKKKLFISFLKLMGVQKKITFHATDVNEEKFIHDIFGDAAKVLVAQNFPNTYSFAKGIEKKAGEIKLASIALISPMKNHALVLEALKSCKAKVYYDIYGPVKDENYWKECKAIIDSLPSHINVTYKGSLEPALVKEVLTDYHCTVLPSKSENFGHSIYEALSAGLPVITSHFTFWNHLEAEKAGYNVSIEDSSEITSAIESIASFDQAVFHQWSENAKQVAERAINLEQIKHQYNQLFQ